MTAPRANLAPIVSERWVLATLLACVAYVLAYTQEWTLFSYYPMVGEFHWQGGLPGQGDELGPRITYYGWKAIGLLAGGAVLCLPTRWLSSLLSGWSWLSANGLWFGLLAVLALIGAHEAHWFLS